jgi:hypothetical protein
MAISYVQNTTKVIYGANNTFNDVQLSACVDKQAIFMAAAARYNSTTINVDMAGIVSHDTR